MMYDTQDDEMVLCNTKKKPWRFKGEHRNNILHGNATSSSSHPSHGERENPRSDAHQRVVDVATLFLAVVFRRLRQSNLFQHDDNIEQYNLVHILCSQEGYSSAKDSGS